MARPAASHSPRDNLSMDPTIAIPESVEASSDRALVLAYSQGDTGAFEVLLARHEGPLILFVRRMLGARLAAEVGDVYRETWERVVSARESASPDDLADWRIGLFTMAHKLSMDRLRTSDREAAFLPPAAEEEDSHELDAALLLERQEISGASGMGSQSAVFWRAAGSRLLACLDELPAEQRSVFLLHQEDGFTLDVMAATLGTDAGAVRSSLRQGLGRLRLCMRRHMSTDAIHPRPRQDAFRDPWLRRALAHAPDRSIAPDARVRDVVLRDASEAVGALSHAHASASGRSLRAARSGRRGSRPGGGLGPMARGLTVAAAAVIAVLAVLLWQRAPVTGANADAPRETGVHKPGTKPSDAGTLLDLAQSGDSPSRIDAGGSPSGESSSSPVPAPLPRLAPEPPVAAIARPPAVIPPPIDAATGKQRRVSAPATSSSPGDHASPDGISTPARRAETPPGKSIGTVDAVEPPSFAALSQWDRITITPRQGESRSLQRAEAGELNLLLGSAALSAVGPKPLSGAPDWRVTLERDGKILAVFEMTSTQVRWRESQSQAATGTPSGPALSALRAALRSAVQPPAEVAEPRAAEPPRNP